jgi:hypothetical protein
MIYARKNTNMKWTWFTTSYVITPSQSSHKNLPALPQNNIKTYQHPSTDGPCPYVGKETTYITNIFRHSDLRIAYRTNNTIHNHLIHKNQSRDKFCSSGVYKVTCPYCKKAYVGQTGEISMSDTMNTSTRYELIATLPDCTTSQRTRTFLPFHRQHHAEISQ